MRNWAFIPLAIILLVLLLPFGYNLVQSISMFKQISWMFAIWSYYFVVVLICATLLVIHPFRNEQFTSYKKVLLVLCVFILPISVCLIEHPIYEDMLWDLSSNMLNVETTADYRDADLVLIAIADCPYCQRAVSDINALHQRNPILRMRMVVCTADSSWLEPYRAQVAGACQVVMASNMDVMATHAGGHFPAYVLVRDGKPLRRWTNNEWGPVAKDVVETVVDR